jgi:hypothetical protein
MCDPTSLFAGSMGLSALEAISSYQGQAAAYDQSVQQAGLNRELATGSALSQYAALAARQTQEREAAAASVDDTARRASEARATARVAAGEAGVAGESVNALLEDYTRQEYDFQVRTSRNSSFLDTQFSRERDATRLGLKSNLLNSQPIAKPSMLNPLIGFGAQSLTAFQASFYNPETKKYEFGDSQG